MVDLDLWQPESWRRIRPLDPPLQRAFAHSLADAHALRDELRRRPMPTGVNVTVIAGDCVATAHRVLMRRDGSFVFYSWELLAKERRLEPLLFEVGDGTVPLSSASSGGGEAMLFCDGHQGIATDPNVQHALIRILRQQPRR
jgi:hypothetical protein